MKINEVERQVGITKGNIRFYEKEGLLTPGRNSENGYREYSEADVVWLKKIKLLRMLDVPIEEILRLRAGELTLEDAMGRHMIQLERKQSNLAAMQTMCSQLRERRSQLDTLDVDEVLSEMEQKEQEGTKFMDVQKKDRRVKYVGPVVAAALMLVLMGGLIGVMVWAFAVDPQNAPPLWVEVLLVAIPAVVIVGVLLALYQRVKQIKGGEEDAAAQY
jgi:DNA-binding transcriptional MerR regulator